MLDSIAQNLSATFEVRVRVRVWKGPLAVAFVHILFLYMYRTAGNVCAQLYVRTHIGLLKLLILKLHLRPGHVELLSSPCLKQYLYSVFNCSHKYNYEIVFIVLHPIYRL